MIVFYILIFVFLFIMWIYLMTYSYKKLILNIIKTYLPLLLMLISIVSCTYTGIMHGSDFILKSKSNIYSLNTIRDLNGQFILGSGNIDNEPSYYYYCKNNNGNYVLCNCETRFAELQLSDIEEPNIKIYYCPFTLDNKYILTIPSNSLSIEYNANIK